jgi:phosphatidate phosphatase APP1
MAASIPILLSFYALSNGSEALICGQLTRTAPSDLSFINFGRRRTFRTLLSLYRAKPLINQSISLRFNSISINTKTDASGSFFFKHKIEDITSTLQAIELENGDDVLMIEGLYLRSIHHVINPFLVISDIDDTLIHSYISNKIKQFRTLAFTPVERRKAVVPMQEVMKRFSLAGASSIYLSNSELNLYPLIYRFLIHNDFPAGPLFLKRLRRFSDLFRYRKLSERDVHKMKILDEVLPMFRGKKFALVGDNTQRDLTIYLSAAEKYPESIRFILIRRVVKRSSVDGLVDEAKQRLSQKKIELYYSDNFPSTFNW